MSYSKNPFGFFALWRNKASEYHTDPREEFHIREQIQQAFTEAREQGVRISNLYYCRWSSEYKYLTFWLCPSFSIIETTMDQLDGAGDFKFADSVHFVGERIHEEGAEEEGYVPALSADPELKLGFFALWRQSPSFYRLSNEKRTSIQKNIYKAFNEGRALGIHTVGIFNCHWSSHWDYFTFWQVPNLEVLETTVGLLEQAGDFWISESRHIVGNLSPEFHSGRQH